MSQVFQINIALCSEELNSTETEALRLPSLPATFQEIKEKVEDLFSIPACVQTLWIQESKIHDPANTKPSSFYLQNDDTVKVTYPIKGECDRVKEVLKWLAKCYTALDEVKNSQSEEDVRSLVPHIKTLLLNQEMINSLSISLFTPTTNKTKWVNILHFDNLGGIDLLVKFHEKFIFFRKNDVFKSLHSAAEAMESICCCAFTLLSKHITIRKRVTDCGGLNTCIETFLRSDVEHGKDYTKYSLFAICK